MDKVNVLGVGVSNVTLKEALDYSMKTFFDPDQAQGKIIVTPNPEFMVKADQDADFKAVLNQADLCLPDGIGVIKGAKYLGLNLKEKVGGYTYTLAVVEALAKRQGSVYLLGGQVGVADKAAEIMKRDYPGIQIAGCQHGYFKADEEEAIVAAISESQADYLIVCLGVIRQENFMFKYREQLNVKAMIGNGGALDTLCGVVKRAPVIWQKLGLEWLYRALDDKKRFKRLKDMIPAYFKLLKQEKKKMKN